MTSHAAETVPTPAPRTRLRLVPAPQPGVPYDDERTDTGPQFERPPAASRTSSRGIQETLALTFELPSGVPAVPAPSPTLRVVNRGVGGAKGLTALAGGARTNQGEPDPAGPGHSEPTDASRWAALIAQAIVEAEVGDRPMSQLVRWTTDAVYAEIAARCAHHGQRNATARRAISRALVMSVHVCPISQDVAEACATVRRNGRARAVAMRLERVMNGWRCTAVSLG